MPQDQSRWTALNSDLARMVHAGPEALCDAIAHLYYAIADTPEPLLQDYAGFTEAMLADGLPDRAGQVAGGTAQVAAVEDARATLLDAGRLLRALEQNAAELSHFLESDLGEDLEATWRTTDGQHFVIPRMTPLAKIDGKPFLRRALLHFRVLPTRIGDFMVRLHRSTLVADSRWAGKERAGSERSYGAALFPGLAAELAYPDPDSFTVAGLSGFDAPACIADHLRDARDAECCAVVWGELTMPEASVDLVRTTLAASALEGCGPLRYLVAGSWHSQIDGEMRNAAQVLDGFGEPLFAVLKWAKFSVGEKLEAISPGNEVHVLIGEDELTVVAICRDFLHATTDVPYLRLNVDVAVVPSMIASIEERATLAGHAATANTMRVRYGTRTLVVAQPAQPGAAGVGQVLAFPAKPLEQGGEIVAGPWRLCLLANA